VALRLKLFGHLEISDEAAAIVSSLRPRARRLLAYLLLHRRAPLARERIAFALWPDSSEPEALGTLRRALSDLRAALPPPAAGDWVSVDRGVLRWNVDRAYRLDIEAFERLIQQATPAALHDAVALYTGDLLADLDDEWVLVERERLRQMQLLAVLRLVAHHRALGEYDAALGLARRALALDPLAEAVHRELIALHYEAGDRASALAQYERLRALLHDEIGVEPMAETQALRAAIVQGAALPAAAPLVQSPADLAAHAAHPLIGRAAEIDWLSALWEGAATGHGRLVIVSGEAGVGKTHLVRGLADYVARRGGLALVGHCYEFERALPYQAIVEMLRAAANPLRHADLAPAHRAALARLAPDLLGAAGVPATAAATSSEEVRAQLYEALVQVFLSLGRGQPSLLIVEDAHWAAESTLDWLTYMAPRLHASRLLVVITYRTDEVGATHALARLRQRFVPEGASTALSLTPLSRAAHHDLVAQLSGLDPATIAPVADRLFAETAGNPFFLYELLRGLIEAGQLVVDQGRWSGPFVAADPPANGAVVPLPDSLRATIDARLGRLNEMSRMFLGVAAVAGRVFDYEVVRRAGGWPEEPALSALEDGLARGFVQAGETSGMFAFVHHLVREIIYTGLTAPRRAYLHRRLADTLAQAANRQPPAARLALAGQITQHALRGEDSALVFQWAPLAAEHAQELHAYTDALSALELAADALDRLRREPDFDLAAGEQQHVDVLLNLAALIPHVGRPTEEHGRILQAAAELLERYPDARRQALYALRQCDYLEALSQYERAIEAAFDAYTRFLELGDRQRAAQCLYEAGRCKITIGQNLAGHQCLEQALALYRAIDDLTGETLGLSGLAWSEMNLGRVESALAHLGRALELSEQRADRLGIARTCYSLAVAWSYYNNSTCIQEYAERSMRLYREMGLASAACRPMFMVGEAYLVRGDTARAQPICEQVCAAAHANGDSWLEGWATHTLGRLALIRGDQRQAYRQLRRAYQIRQESGERQNQINDLIWLGRLRLGQGRAAVALKYTRQAMTLLESLWDEVYVWEMQDVFMGHAETLAANGDLPDAQAYVQRAYATLMRFAAQIGDPTVRQIFFDHPTNARLIVAWERGWPLQGRQLGY
jgi:predicted ATPase/DNA-binding SARP family transcriptional activator